MKRFTTETECLMLGKVVQGKALRDEYYRFQFSTSLFVHRVSSVVSEYRSQFPRTTK